MIDIEKLETYKLADDVAIKWFEIHAEQRLKLFNFFLIIAGFCVAGSFAALQAKNDFAASIVSVVLCFVSYLFKQLDRRTVLLLGLPERYLYDSLNELAENVKSQSINFILRAADKSGTWSYRQVFNALFWLFGILGLLGTIFPWVRPKILELII